MSAATALHQGGIGAGGESWVLGTHGVVTKVQVPVGCGRVGGCLSWDGVHLDAAGAGVLGRRVGEFVVAIGAHGSLELLSRFLHAQEPSAPVEENDPDLDEDTRTGHRGQCYFRAGVW